MRLPRFTTLQLLLAATLVALLLGLFTSAWRASVPHDIVQVRFSPDGKYLAARYSSGTVRVWRLEGSQPRLVVRAFGWPPLPREGHQEMLESICFVDNTRLLKLDGGLSSYLRSPVRARELDLGTGKVKQVLQLALNYTQQDIVAASGDHLYVVDYANSGKVVRCFDLAKGESERDLRARPEPVLAVGLSSDGKWLATKDQSGTLAIIDAASGQTMHEFVGTPISGAVGTFLPVMEISGDGSRVAVRDGGSKPLNVMLFDARNGTAPQPLTLPAPNGIAQLSISHDGSVLAVNHDDAIECYETTATKRLCRIARGQLNGGATAPTDYMAIAPDGKSLATYGDDRIWIWDVAAGQVMHKLGGTSRLLNVLIFVAGFTLWAAAWGIVGKRARVRDAATIGPVIAVPGSDAPRMAAPLGMKLCWGLMLIGGLVALAIPIAMMFVVGPWLFPTLYFSLLVGTAAIARGAARDTLRLRRTAALQLANMLALDPANVVFAAMEYALLRTSSAQEYLRSVGA